MEYPVPPLGHQCTELAIEALTCWEVCACILKWGTGMVSWAYCCWW